MICKCGTDFSPNATATGRNRFYCKACNAATAKAYRKSNAASVATADQKRSRYPSRIKAAKVWTRPSRLRKFGLTIAEYDQILASQNGGCAICAGPETSLSATIDPITGARVVKMLAVDHDHLTGVVRGLLCTSCNLAIGLLNEDIERLTSAILYLKKAAKKLQKRRPARSRALQRRALRHPK